MKSMTAAMPPLAQIQFNTAQAVTKSKLSVTNSLGLSGSSIHSTITADNTAKNKTTSPTAAGVPKKKVQFKNNVRVRRVSTHRSFSPEERKAMWYSSEESKEIRASAVETVKKIMKGLDVDAEEDDCTRGLEFKTPKKNKSRQKKKQLIIWSVIDEQDRFNEENGHDNNGDFLDLEEICDRDDAVARVYMDQSSQCATEAFNRGLKDAYIAARFRSLAA